MIDKLMDVGDRVVITIPPEARAQGYNPCPDGTKATILSFTEIHYGRFWNFGLKPGVYVNRAQVKLRLKNGREHTEWSDRLELTSKAFQMDRQKKPGDWHNNEEFLRDLPETPFWEADFVKVDGRSSKVFQIIRINYPYLTELTRIGTNYPAYIISSKLKAGWNMPVSEDALTLVARGPVWKFYHDEPIAFDDIQEEALFFEMLGHTEEVQNPATGLYKWTKEEVLDAIRRGVVHGFSVSNHFLESEPLFDAKRFRNEDLGRRVAEATLQGLVFAPV